MLSIPAQVEHLLALWIRIAYPHPPRSRLPAAFQLTQRGIRTPDLLAASRIAVLTLGKLSVAEYPLAARLRVRARPCPIDGP